MAVSDHEAAQQLEFSELASHALARDIAALKRSLDKLSDRAQVDVSCRAARTYACGELQRLRGNQQAALQELTEALALMRPAEHELWAHAASSHVHVLLALSQDEEAAAFGAVYLAQGLSLGCERNLLRIALSLALWRQGHSQRAVELCQRAIDQLREQDRSGRLLALAYEARAQLK